MNFKDFADVGMSLLDRFIPNPKDKVEAEKALRDFADRADKRAHDERMGQIGVNKASATHPHWFVAGARPFCIWAFAITINISVLALVGAIVYSMFTEKGVDANIIAAVIGLIGVLVPPLLGLLGLNVSRTLEKLKGVARDGFKEKA